MKCVDEQRRASTDKVHHQVVGILPLLVKAAET